MGRFPDQTSFKEDGKKQIYCPNCGRHLAQLYLGQKDKEINLKCKECKAISKIKVPKSTSKKGVKGIVYGISSTFTAVPEDD